VNAPPLQVTSLPDRLESMLQMLERTSDELAKSKKNHFATDLVLKRTTEMVEDLTKDKKQLAAENLKLKELIAKMEAQMDEILGQDDARKPPPEPASEAEVSVEEEAEEKAEEEAEDEPKPVD
jgi:hypothetical protein